LRALGHGVSSVVVGENTKHLLEEHTTENNVAGLTVSGAQISNSDVTLSRAARSLHICCKSCKRHAHVVRSAACKVE